MGGQEVPYPMPTAPRAVSSALTMASPSPRVIAGSTVGHVLVHCVKSIRNR